MSEDNATELHRKYRPRRWADVIGQDSAVRILRSKIEAKELPHTVLLSGMQGCGKTSLARLAASKLGCIGMDLEERNCADDRGIDDMRNIIQRMSLAPTCGPVRVWILDEIHMLRKEAQSSMLKPLEEPPPHVYFFLCSTDPKKLLPTIISRCTEIKVAPVSPVNMRLLLKNVTEKEGTKSITEKVFDHIAEVADGSPRKALELLNRIIRMDKEADMLAAVQSDAVRTTAEFIGRLLLDRNSKWADVAKVIKESEEDAESIRQQVLGYASAVLLNSPQGHPRAYLIIEAFSRNFYTNGKAGLVAAAWDVYAVK